MEERFRKWNIVIAMTLAFLVLGILIAALAENKLDADKTKTKHISQLILPNNPDKYAATITNQLQQFCIRAE
jgi:hypothetical protein